MTFELIFSFIAVLFTNFFRFFVLFMCVFDWIYQIERVRRIEEYKHPRIWYYRWNIGMTLLCLCAYKFGTLSHYGAIQDWNSIIMSQIV